MRRAPATCCGCSPAYDPLFAEIYAHDMQVGPPPPRAPSGEPPFVATVPDAEATARLKARYRGLRVLLVVRRFFRDNPARQYHIADNLVRSAERFGLMPREFSSWAPPSGVAATDYAAALQAEIEATAPRLIVFEDLFARGITVDPNVGPQVAAVLSTVRRRDGVAVVNMMPDAWLLPPDRLHRGLGEHYDLLNHVHPAALAHGSTAEQARTFCFPFPFMLPTPTVPAGGTARACFVGSINQECPARMAWWAEAVRAGVKLDVLLTDHAAAAQRSDLDYANLLHGYRLSVTLSRRSSGVRIITGRSFEIALSGGVLLEEDSLDARYFYRPGEHYVPFETLGELQAQVAALLDDPERCRAIAEIGRAWAHCYFTGDRFWAGVLDRLALPPEG